MRKEPEWNQGGSEGGSSGDGSGGGGGGGGGNGAQTDGAAENAEGVIEGGAENAVQQTYPEVITSVDEIHEVGTLAQVRVPVLYIHGWRAVRVRRFVSLAWDMDVRIVKSCTSLWRRAFPEGRSLVFVVATSS